MGSNKRQCYLVMNIIKHCWYLIHVERQKETVRVYALMSQMKTIITTLVATIFRQFGRRFELFDITGLIQYTYIVAKWVQINFIFNDNLRILCLFRNIKVQKTVKLSEISWHKGRPNRFRWRHLWCKLLYCYRFHSVDLHESGTNNALLGPWLNNMKFIWPPLLVLKIAQL